MTQSICYFYGCLVTYETSTSNFNSFVRYSSLTNSVFYLIKRFFVHNSRFFQYMSSLKKSSRAISAFIFPKKNIHEKILMNELDFCLKAQKNRFLSVLGLFGPSSPIRTFLYFMNLKFHVKITKN